MTTHIHIRHIAAVLACALLCLAAHAASARAEFALPAFNVTFDAHDRYATARSKSCWPRVRGRGGPRCAESRR